VLPVIELTTEHGVVELALLSPPCNELGRALIEELDQALDQVVEMNAKVLLVYSRVEAGFCAGADLRELLTQIEATPTEQRRSELSKFLEKVHSVLLRLDELPLVTVGALHGICFGGGLELALTLDVRIADRSTRFAFPEVRLGLIPGFGGIALMQREVGNGPIRDLLLSGRSIGARAARQLSLVSQVTAVGKGLEVARRLARRLVNDDPAVLAEVKKLTKPSLRDAFADNRRRFLQLALRPAMIDALEEFRNSQSLFPYLRANK